MSDLPPVANATLFAGMSHASKAKPDKQGMCNGGHCLMLAAAVVERSLPDATALARALGGNDFKRILKAADMMEERARSLREAVAWVQQGHNGHA